MTDGQLPLFETAGRPPSDVAHRAAATDPARNVVLEASAGTGKTSVLVTRYLNLLRAGVDPTNVLAITFTRQAAAQMRARIIAGLRDESARPEGRARWDELHDRLGEIAISTVDAFCLSLLREFPLEADLDPGFSMADETEVPRLVEDAVERALTVGAAIAAEDAGVATLLARLGPWKARTALAHLLKRRLVVPGALHRFLVASPPELTAERACRGAVASLADRLGSMERARAHLTEHGPLADPFFGLVVRDLAHLASLETADPARIRGALDRFRTFFLTRKGTTRKRFSSDGRGTRIERQRYLEAALALAPVVRDTLLGFDRDLNVAMARGVQRLFAIAETEYRRALDGRALLDFSDVLRRAVDLLRQMDEFARSRYRLESRYHHVLVDEFQDTSRAQWQLVSLLVQSWGEGSGLVHEAPIPPSVFIVGDRKQSIYRFRDAEVAVLQDAADEIAGLREGGDVRFSIAQSFRAVPGLLSFVNDLFAGVDKKPARRDAFRYDAQDRFPPPTDPGEDPATPGGAGGHDETPLGLVVGGDVEACAEAVASEVVRLIETGVVRDPKGGVPRAVRPADIGILFRARASHREFERALERRDIPASVYKGLGFFDADEIKDARALIRFLAAPASELRAAALLRSRLARVSDGTLLSLAGRLSSVLTDADDPVGLETLGLDEDDRRALTRLRTGLRGWLALVDQVPPAELIDRILTETAYVFELRGRHLIQARENLKKLRGLVRRIQNRGYATMARVADHIDRLSGDISNATLEAFDAVNLMTVHAAKGLEFPVVFLVDLGRGTGAHAPPIRVVPDRGDGRPSVSVWPFRSEADEDERQRELEETKRLLYVAMTRARDRLYLAALIEDGAAKINRGSLAEVLPASFALTLAAAAGLSDGSAVVWAAPDGGGHALRVCSGAREDDRGPSRAPTVSPPVDRFAPLPLRPAIDRRSVTDMVGSEGQAPGRDVDASQPSNRVIGRLVHRMLERFQGRAVEPAAARACAVELLRPDEALDVADVEEATGTASSLYARLTGQPELVALVMGPCLFEVPFSLLVSGADLSGRVHPERPILLRGTIDWLVRGADGGITVLELKTGRPRPEHQRQIDLYTRAVKTMFPGVRVDARLVHP